MCLSLPHSVASALSLPYQGFPRSSCILPRGGADRAIERVSWHACMIEEKAEGLPTRS